MAEQQLQQRSKSLLNISSIDDAIRASEILSKSGLVPDKFKGKPADILVAMQWGAELGSVQPLQALNGIAVVNGTPSIYGDLGKALVLREHDLANFVLETSGEGRDMAAVCEIGRQKPNGRINVKRTFTMQDAERAGLGSRGPWKQYPARMLMWRAFWLAARDIYADVLSGLQGAEELEDLPHEIKAQKAKPARPPAVERVAAAFSKVKAIEPVAPMVVVREDDDEMVVVRDDGESPPPHQEPVVVDAWRAFWLAKSADTKTARFTDAESYDLMMKSKTISLSGMTKAELVTRIGQMKQTLSLSMPQFIEIAKSGAGLDYDGGNPAALSSQNLKDLHLALEHVGHARAHIGVTPPPPLEPLPF